MLKELRNLLAFLTVLPLRMDMDCLSDSAKFIFLFPLVGALIGLLAGVFGWAVGFFLPSLVVGGLVFGVVLLLTGLHHTDGLLDFGDAVMVHGSAERKMEVMHDQLTGAGAVGLGLVVYLVTAFGFVCVAVLGGGFVVCGVVVPFVVPVLVVVECVAKLSMVVCCWAGKSVHKGMSSGFLEVMHGKGGGVRLVAALVLSFLVAVPLLWVYGNFLAGFVVVLSAVLSGLVMVAVAHRHFGGVSGDVLGAANEVTRLVAVVVLLAML